MAITSYGVNDPLAVKLWSKKLTVEALKQTWFSRFVGRDAGSLVQIKDETSKGPGDKVTYGLRMQGTGAGVIGDGTLQGNEEALVTYSDGVLINQLRHAVEAGGRMSQQRVPFDVRQEALDLLVDWWADRMDTAFFNQLAGNAAVTDTRYTGLNATIAPDANHYQNVAGGSNDQGLSSSNLFTLSAIDAMVEAARTLTPAIRPIRIGGKSWYVLFLHPYQVTDLRAGNATAGSWYDIQKAAMTGGLVRDNPIFDGSIGVYNGVIVHEDARVPLGFNSSSLAPISTVRRGIFCGAQAIMLAYGRNNGPEKYNWVEELFDYKNLLGVSAGCIFGMKKAVFNSADYATIVMSSYATAHNG